MTTVVRSAAVTSTVTVLLPVCRALFPVMSTLAPGSVGSAMIVTEVVPLSTFTTEASETSSPLTVKTARLASLFLATAKVTVYTSVSPLAAVTVTVKVLLPVPRLSSPAISTVASTSEGSAITSTDVVP